METSTPDKYNTTFEWVKSSAHSLLSERELDIYAFGKEKGVEEYKKQVHEMMNTNFARSYEDTSRVLTKLRDLNINVVSARLKVESLSNLKIALSIYQDDNLNNSISDIYDFISEIEDNSNSDNYRIEFSIIKAQSQDFSDKHVENDGYFYKHRLLANEKSARTA